MVQSVLAQKPVVKPITIYYDGWNKRVDSTRDFTHYQYITPLSGSLVRLEEYSATGMLREVGEWEAYDLDSVQKAIPVGLHRYYRTPDTLWHTRKYQGGKMIERRAYFPDGRLKRLEQYSNDSLMVGKCYHPDGNERPFFQFEQRPEFPGGADALMAYISRNLVYPKKARKRGVQGKVVVTFVVDKTGAVTNVEAIEKIGMGCDQEAVRVIQDMPRWTPGYVDEVPVKVRYTLPLTFRLDW